MAKDPAFPFYAQDFLSGTAFMTLEETGAYIKILAHQWNIGKIPKKRLGFVLGLGWETVWENIKDKFIEDGDYIFNVRLEEEREKRAAFKEKQSKNGSLGGRPKKEKSQNKAKRKPNYNPKESQTITQIESQKKPLEDEDEKEDEIRNKKIEYQKIVNIFNSVCKNLPSVQKITGNRKSVIKARINEYGLSKIGDVFQKVSLSNFLNGENDRGWNADFDWIMNPNNFIKILEGKYQTNGKKDTSTSSHIRNMQKADKLVDEYFDQ